MPWLEELAKPALGCRRLAVGVRSASVAPLKRPVVPRPIPPEIRQSGILPGRTVDGTGVEPVTSSVGEKHPALLASIEVPP